MSVVEETGRLGCQETKGIIDDFLIRAARDSFIGGEVQLTRGIIAPMANGATPLEDRLHVPPVIDCGNAGCTWWRN
ncbi:hypothetical protein W02_36230 [Nitrospira sp. KM1]|nr:hypothetical protein W02_36230 [Nitrospira sp. KM1]